MKTEKCEKQLAAKTHKFEYIEDISLDSVKVRPIID